MRPATPSRIRVLFPRGAVRGFLAGLAGVLYAMGAVVLVASPAAAATPVSGGGSSFATPEIQQWTAEVASPPYNLNVNWAGSSSSAGRDDYAQGVDQYAASDIIYYSEDGPFAQQAQTDHPFKYVTVSAGGLSFMYNIVIGGTRWTGLDLTQQEVCQIFTGALTNWSQLAATPGDSALAGVDQPINAVLRSDGAGESYVLSQYCIAVDPTDWQNFVTYVEKTEGESAEAQLGWHGDTDMATGQPVEFWPPNLEDGQKNSNLSAGSAASDVVDVTSGATGAYSIGYMATAYAKAAGFPVASVRNGAGNYVQPTSNNVQLALAYASQNPVGTFNLNFTGTNPNAYFPSTYSYVLAPTSTKFPANAGADATLATFLCFVTGQGQNDAQPLAYAPLSAQVTQLSVNAIQAIPGAPPASSCGKGGPAPSVAPPPTPPPPPSTIGTGNGLGLGGGPGTSGPNGTPSGNSPGGPTSGGTTTTTSAAGARGGTAASKTGSGGSSAGGSGGTSGAGSGSRSASGGNGGSSASGLGLSGGGSNALADATPTSVELASGSNAPATTNFQTYTYLIIGAVVCGVGVTAVGTKRGGRR